MKRLCLVGGVAALLSAQRVVALHALKDGFFLPRDPDLQFSHMGKSYGQGRDESTRGAEQPPSASESPAAGSDESRKDTDDVKGGSQRSMDNVPVADLKRGDGGGGASNNSTNKSSNSNNTTNNSTHSDNNSKTDQSQSHHSETNYGASHYRGDTSTYVTNNFFNPPMADAAWEDHPRGAKLELQYLWKRINVIDDKLDKLMPIAGGDPRLDPSKRKGLVITFDAQSNPGSPTVNLEDSIGENDML
ncbi:uncharacterized protein BcabD6B2_38010 [Babesia caballi]|uniref:Membrane protein, putative n=1 Tax=Babesia caballi TaxID=5871 RepID=A0AAV4LW15_BABCB|nr:membrane protein, putative [Babesia caballi]